MSADNGSGNGTNGTHTSVAPAGTPVELMSRVARYRASLVALLAMVKRNSSEYRPVADQQLIRQIERLLDEDPR